MVGEIEEIIEKVENIEETSITFKKGLMSMTDKSQDEVLQHQQQCAHLTLPSCKHTLIPK